MHTNVAGAGSSQKGIDDGVAQNVAVAVARQSGGMGNRHATQDEEAAFSEGMGV
jgi:hypothetical protein